MASKLTVAFESTGGITPCGWSESFYSDLEATNLDSLQAVLDLGYAYTQIRKQLLGTNVKITFIRATPAKATKPEATTRISQVYFLKGNEGVPSSPPIPPATFEPSQMDLFVLMRTFQGHHRPFFLSGMPQGYINTAAATGVEAFFVTNPAFTQWSAFIIAKRLYLRHTTTPMGVITYNYEKITKVVPEDLRKRNRGRPFRLFRGRKLA